MENHSCRHFKQTRRVRGRAPGFFIRSALLDADVESTPDARCTDRQPLGRQPRRFVGGHPLDGARRPEGRRSPSQCTRFGRRIGRDQQRPRVRSPRRPRPLRMPRRSRPEPAGAAQGSLRRPPLAWAHRPRWQGRQGCPPGVIPAGRCGSGCRGSVPPNATASAYRGRPGPAVAGDRAAIRSPW